MEQEVLFFSHDYGISEEKFLENDSLKENYHITSTYKMEEEGKNYVGSIQNKNFPIFGVQYHPEKSIY